MKTNKLAGLCNVNVELTSRCNKDCWMCGRRKIDKDYPEIAMNYGDMDFDLVRTINAQIESVPDQGLFTSAESLNVSVYIEDTITGAMDSLLQTNTRSPWFLGL